ncbi:hypothetical protein IJT10_07560 [bacterium]|nr:hypothetical protein [bacterium]
MSVRTIIIFTLMLATFWGMNFVSSDANETPDPSPTSAISVKQNHISFKATASVSQVVATENSEEMAYNIAELEVLNQIAISVQNGNNKDNLITWDKQAGGCEYLGWLAKTHISRLGVEDGAAQISARNVTWGSYRSQSDKSFYKMLYRGDFDKDGKYESIYLCPDSSLEVRRGKRIIGALYPLNSFQSMRSPDELTSKIFLPSKNFISYTEIKSIDNVELEGDNLIIDVLLDRKESIYGLYALHNLEKRQYTLQVAKDNSTPFINILEPISDRVEGCKNVPLKGRIDAPAGILSANLLVNGEQVWASPLGFKSDNLVIDMRVNLRQGNNKVEFNITDREGRKVSKVVTMHTPPSEKIAKTRAIIVGNDKDPILEYSSEKALKIRQTFIDRGYIVKTLTSQEATRENILAAFDSLTNTCTASDQVVLYFAGVCQCDKGFGYVTAGDNECLTMRDLENFHKRLPGVRLISIWDLYTLDNNSSTEQFSVRESNKFARQLDSRYGVCLISGLTSQLNKPATGKDLTSVFIDNFQNCHGDLIKAFRYTYPVICSNELENSKKTNMPPQLPTLLTF